MSDKTIPAACETNLRNTFSQEGFVDQIVNLFNQMVGHAEENELPAVTVSLPLYSRESGLVEGDWAPEIHLVGRKVIGVEDPEEVEDQEEDEEDA